MSFYSIPSFYRHMPIKQTSFKKCGSFYQNEYTYLQTCNGRVFNLFGFSYIHNYLIATS